jgi:catechol-2,3-dioxygenase
MANRHHQRLDVFRFGLNTWHSLGATPLPANGYGLAETEIWLNGRSALKQLSTRLGKANWPFHDNNGDRLVTDPSGINLRFKYNQENIQ